MSADDEELRHGRFKRSEFTEIDGFDDDDEEESIRQRRDTVVAAGNRTLNQNAELEANRTKAAQAAALKAAQERIQAMLHSPNISEVIYQYYEDAGFKIEDTFLECSFEGYNKQKFNCQDIVRPVVDANYFLCYVVDLPDELKQTVAGKGLKLVLNSHVNLYPKMSEEKPPLYDGILVSVDKEYNPFNWEKTCVTPGRVTKIDLALTHVHLENFRSGPLIQYCLEESDSSDLFQIFKANYTRTTCQMDCLYQSHKNACNCLLLVDKSQIRDDVLNETGFCSPQQFADCIGTLPDNETVQRAVNQCLSNCNASCESYRYDMRASYAKLYEPHYSKFKLPPNVTANQLIDLRVAYRRLEYAELIQQPSASFADMVSNLGGQLNLWLSASMVGLLEMGFTAIGFCIWSLYVKVFKTKKSEDDEKKEDFQHRKV